MRQFVRHPARQRQSPLIALALALAASSVPVVATSSHASGATIAQSEAVIAALSRRLARLSQTGETTANAYDNASAHLAVIEHQIRRLDGRLTNTRAAVAVASSNLSAAIIRYYVAGPVSVQAPSYVSTSPIQGAERALYENLAIATMDRLRTTYERQRASLLATISQVEVQRSQARATTSQMSSLLAENKANTAQTQATLATITHSLATTIISYEIHRGVAAAKQHDTAGEVQAVAAASSVGGQAAANQVTLAIQSATAPVVPQTPLAPSAQGLAAVHFAESQIGVPYVWGGETPGVGFDCSGLVQWAWGRAGVSIPRTTETQWPTLAHVALTALQPGDLLYYFNLDGDHLVDHLVMYVGSGPYGTNTVIAAAHSGTLVSYAPLFTAGLIGAARP